MDGKIHVSTDGRKDERTESCFISINDDSQQMFCKIFLLLEGLVSKRSVFLVKSGRKMERWPPEESLSRDPGGAQKKIMDPAELM